MRWSRESCSKIDLSLKRFKFFLDMNEKNVILICVFNVYFNLTLNITSMKTKVTENFNLWLKDMSFISLTYVSSNKSDH